MTTKVNKRLILPDVLKGLAVVFMIQVHVMEQFVNPDLLSTSMGKLSLFLGGVPAAPVFMVVMGYFAAHTKSGFKKLLKRGITLFLGGIALNVMLNLSYIIKYIQSGYPELIAGSIFGADILPLAGMALIIVGLIIRITRNPIILIAIAFLIVGVTPWINISIDGITGFRYFTAFIGGTAEWSYFPLFPWLAYPLSGLAVYYAGLSRWESVPHYLKWFIIVMALTGFILGVKMGFNISTSLNSYYHHDLLFYLWALAFMILIIYFLRLLKTEVYPMRFAFLGYMGKEVTLVYIIQWILIGNLAAWTGGQIMISGYIALSIGFIIVSVLLSYIYRNITSNNK